MICKGNNLFTIVQNKLKQTYILLKINMLKKDLDKIFKTLQRKITERMA